MMNFTPDGRHAAKSGAQEYEIINGCGKVASMIMFIIAKVMPALRAKNIGVFGTSRFKQNWPPENMRKIEQNTVTSTTSITQSMNMELYLVVGWTIALCFVCQQSIRLTTMIDDYNHKMGRVDLIDQRIAYYHLNLRCQKNWLPMFVQGVGIIRNNSFVVHYDYWSRLEKQRKSSTHKDFALDMVQDLVRRAREEVLAQISKRRDPLPSGEKDRDDNADYLVQTASLKRRKISKKYSCSQNLLIGKHCRKNFTCMLLIARDVVGGV